MKKTNMEEKEQNKTLELETGWLGNDLLKPNRLSFRFSFFLSYLCNRFCFKLVR